MGKVEIPEGARIFFLLYQVTQHTIHDELNFNLQSSIWITKVNINVSLQVIDMDI